ncbi:MAG: yhfR, partial [Bacilli bacterium]|nr:yhfR [Bacilli bacterium]
MTTVCLVRHGETDWNAEGRLQGRQDTELNENGRKQAKLAGIHLKNEQWDAIVTSPLKRAKETAQIIATELGIDHLDEMEQLV